MTLIQSSTLVDAPKASAVSKYNLSINGKVNTNDVVVDKKADTLYNAIYKNYTELNKYFKAIADEYRKCANHSVKGTKMVSSLKKVAKNCENQGKYCLKRQKNLKNFYTKAITEKNTRELNEAIDSIDGLKSENETLNNNYSQMDKNYNTLSDNYSSLQSETESLNNRFNDLQGNYNSLTENYANLNNSYNDLYDQFKALQEKVNNLSNK